MLPLSYDDFVAYVKESHWRTNDPVLVQHIDTIINQAESELDPLTKHWDRREAVKVLLPTSTTVDLDTEVPDFASVTMLSNNSYVANPKELSHTTASHVYQLQITATDYMPYYNVSYVDDVRTLVLVGNYSADAPGSFTMVYKKDLPDYRSTGASWFADKYFNLYLFTVMKHIGVFLREDDRIQMYSGLQQEAFTLANEDDAHNVQFGGAPLHKRPVNTVPR